MAFERFIAFRHLRKRRKTGFISLITFISVAGVAVGVMALFVVLAVMSGFDTELKSKIVNVQPHLRIEKIGGMENAAGDIQKVKAQNISGLRNIAAYVEGQAIIRSDENATGIMVKGVDLDNSDLSAFMNHFKDGSLDFKDEIRAQKKRKFLFFSESKESRIGGILIGETLAQVLRVRVGDEVSLISPFKDDTQKMIPVRAESRNFIVRGIFRIGMSDFDTSLALIRLDHSQDIYHMGEKVTGLSLRFDNVDQAEQWKVILRSSFTPDYYLRSWFDMNRNFFQALKVEKSVMTILLALIILVAAFNIVSTLIMMVMEKTKDIGILRALGATRGSIRKIFLIEGFTIGILGVFFGTLSGLLVAYNLNPIADFIKETTGFEVFPSDIYYFDRIPAEVHQEDVVIIVIFAVIASLLAGIYPAHRASKMNPVEALRYE